MTYKKRTYSLIAVLLFACLSFSQVRKEINLQNGWKFSRDSIHWQDVKIPHDWAISGPFNKKWDLQYVAITQNGEKKKTEKTGRSGALPWIGRGFYRTTFVVPAQYAKALLHFDGAMAEPTVYINGKKAGYWAYGYNAFEIDATPFIRHDGTPNTMEVDLQNLEESSRWYPGAGIYRPVTLILTGNTSIDHWGTYFRTLQANGQKALISIDTKIKGIQNSNDFSAEIGIYDNKGFLQQAEHTDIPSNGIIHSEIILNHPKLWSPESPYLYRLVTRLYRNHQLIDETTEKVGVRAISFDKENGFRLNGIRRKFKGVCLHHDLGPLGAAVNKAALIRQVRILKDMGCDAIRTSHNMPSTMQMEVYDSLGVMVMAESFDMWNYPKCKNGYARFFKDWSDRDITNLILNHRNHPSLIMWSIGNEIPEQGSKEGQQIAAHLQTLCHQLDPSRPVTQGMDRAEDALKSGFAQTMDIPGFNYRVYKYGRNIKQLPQGFLLGSETASTVSSRGVYKFPVEWSNSKTYPDGQCNGYDTQWCSWSNLPEEDFIAQEDVPYTIGQFVWTGFDYLGEPTPYDAYWPSRSSYFGICDLAGLPKDRYYLYRSVWNTKEHTIHLLPHWTWPGREGKITPVFCYTDYPTAELFVNGKSQGKISKIKGIEGEVNTGKPATPAEAQERARRYRLMWNKVIYEPGELKVVVYDKTGNKAGEEIIHTAGKADRIVLEADRPVISADGNDLCFITVSLADKEGTMVPDANDELTFQITGDGNFKGVCNGDATSLEVFTQPKMKLFSGQLVLIVQSNNHKGTIHVKVVDAKKKLAKTLDIKTL
jgi:beta-galactosidase